MTAAILFLVFWPFAGAAASYAVGKVNRKFGNCAVCLTAALEAAVSAGCFFYAGMEGHTGEITTVLEGICGRGIGFTADGFRLLYGAVAGFMWLVSAVFSLEYMEGHEKKDRYYLFLLLTLGGVMGVFFSADLFTTFLFFELMSFTSYVWVVQEETREALRAGATYLAVAVIGGLVMLMGLFLTEHALGTLQIDLLRESVAAYKGEKALLWGAGICLLFGFGAKAGAVPMHIWLPKAHPVAPAPASALLSGLLTKAGIFGILILSFQMFAGNVEWGILILVTGTVTMLTGAVLALFAVNLKRTLACSSVSQIGFILTGIGMAGIQTGEGRVLAAGGSLLHMVNHSLLKLVLFCGAGVVYQNIHRLELNEIRGFGRKKPWLKAVFLMGSLGISGIPLWNGYISKMLLHESMVIYSGSVPDLLVGTIEWLFLISGGLTVAYMLKLYSVLFIEKNMDASLQARYEEKKRYITVRGKIALSVPALLLPLTGIFPSVFLEPLANRGRRMFGLEEPLEGIAYFSMESLSGALISIAIGCMVYFLIIRRWMIKDNRYVNRWKASWDMEDGLYRPALEGMILFVSVITRICDRVTDYMIVGIRRTAYKDAKLPHELEEGNMATHLLGVLLDDGKEALNHTVYKKHPIRVSFEHKLALLRQELKENNTLIARSMSFGLLLSCIGLLLTLIYMLWW